MGAVRNSNTRASHASVEAVEHSSAATGGHNLDSSSKPGFTSVSGAAGGAGGQSALDSPHLNFNEASDRRPSFSYLRRASDRRRRRRMLERGMEDNDIGSPRQQYKEFVYPRNSAHHAHQASARDGWSTRDSVGSESHHQQQHADRNKHEHSRSLKRADQIDDEEADQLYGCHDNDSPDNVDNEFMNDQQQGHFHQSAGLKGNQQQQVVNMSDDPQQQRRQSVNVDRLTDAVSDVMEFVREESFRKGKRRSMVKRRIGGGSGGGYQSAGAYSGSGFVGGGGHPTSGSLGMGTDEGEFDSEEIASGAGSGMKNMNERSPNYRRRRMMRRSPRRIAQQRGPVAYNDSDTGSGASLSHEHHHHHHHHHQQQQSLPMQMQQQQQHPAAGLMRYKQLQHLGGSAQDAHLMAGAGSLYQHGLMQQHLQGRGAGQLVDQHRRHQSADAQFGGQTTGDHQQLMMRYQRGATVDYNMPQLDEPMEQQHLPGATTTVASGPAQTTTTTDAPLIRPIPVGPSPPPMLNSIEAELVAARRKREEEEDNLMMRGDEEETAIHVSSTGTELELTKKQPQARFIAPKVAPLNSPSALLIPDEEIVPPNVPFRGRRLPQIPGSGIIKSAADFLHSSFYGSAPTTSSQQQQQVVAPATTTLTPTTRQQLIGTSSRSLVGAPLVLASSSLVAGNQSHHPYGMTHLNEEEEEESVFPSVSESPTIKLDRPTQPAAGVVVKKQPTLSGSDGGGRGATTTTTTAAAASTLDSPDFNINFPRVSFSPTHGSSATQRIITAPLAQGQSTISLTNKYNLNAGIAGPICTTQASSVLAPTGAGVVVDSSQQQQQQIADNSSLMGASSIERISGGRAWPRSRHSKKEDEDNWF